MTNSAKRRANRTARDITAGWDVSILVADYKSFGPTNPEQMRRARPEIGRDCNFDYAAELVNRRARANGAVTAKRRASFTPPCYCDTPPPEWRPRTDPMRTPERDRTIDRLARMYAAWEPAV